MQTDAGVEKEKRFSHTRLNLTIHSSHRHGGEGVRHPLSQTVKDPLSLKTHARG
jgi:hypothetical protein